MEKVSSAVLVAMVGMQSQLSDWRLWAKTMNVIMQSSQDVATLVAQLMPATRAACVASWHDHRLLSHSK